MKDNCRYNYHVYFITTEIKKNDNLFKYNICTHLPLLKTVTQNFSGTIIMLNQWSIHHNEDLWPDPFTFKPERFLNEAGKLYSNYHIFKKMPFIPFSRGKRSCIGQHLALDLILVFVVELTRCVNIKHPTNFVQDSSAKINMILQPQPFPIECTRKQRYDRCHLQE